MKMLTFDHAILGFRPTPNQLVVVWLHTQTDEHYVGMVAHIGRKHGLQTQCEWLIRVEPLRSGKAKWRPIQGSMQKGNVISFSDPSLKSVSQDRLKIQEGEDEIDLCIGGDHVLEANEILERYGH